MINDAGKYEVKNSRAFEREPLRCRGEVCRGRHSSALLAAR